MKIEPLPLTVRQLCDGYADHAEDGVVAYGGKLDMSAHDALRAKLLQQIYTLGFLNPDVVYFE